MATRPLIRSRLAPTPNGYLHLGNIANFILTWATTRAMNGSLTLRLDDADFNRCKDEYIEDVFTTLNWLGLNFDHGPRNLKEYRESFSQSLKTKDYWQALQAQKIKNLLFVCDCSRKDILSICPEGVYPQTCYHKNMSYSPLNNAIRFKTPGLNIDEPALNDLIIWRRENIPSYQLTSIFDDQKEGINHIIRGEDLLASTQCQQFLARHFDFDQFSQAKIYHHPLMCSDQNQKLSKSKGAQSLRELRLGGLKKEEVFSQVAHFFQFSGEFKTLHDFIRPSLNLLRGL